MSIQALKVLQPHHLNELGINNIPTARLKAVFLQNPRLQLKLNAYVATSHLFRFNFLFLS